MRRQPAGQSDGRTCLGMRALGSSSSLSSCCSAIWTASLTFCKAAWMASSGLGLFEGCTQTHAHTSGKCSSEVEQGVVLAQDWVYLLRTDSSYNSPSLPSPCMTMAKAIALGCCVSAEGLNREQSNMVSRFTGAICTAVKARATQQSHLSPESY